MQAHFTLTRDAISPHLMRKLRKVQNPAPALRSAGMVLVQMAKRSFDEPSLRAATWPPRKKQGWTSYKVREGLKNAGQKKRKKNHELLKLSGSLWKSLRVIGVDKTRVTVGSDRKYAGFHQLGTKHIPARPFFPVTGQGKLTPAAKQRVERAIEIKLGIKN